MKSAMMKREDKVEAAVTAFIRADDNYNCQNLNEVLPAAFRSNNTHFYGNPGLNIIHRETYLALIEQGKIGRNPRTITFIYKEVAGFIAAAKVRMQYEIFVFTSFYQRILNEEVNGKK